MLYMCVCLCPRSCLFMAIYPFTHLPNQPAIHFLLASHASILIITHLSIQRSGPSTYLIPSLHQSVHPCIRDNQFPLK